MKRRLILFAALTIISVFLAGIAFADYWGSKNSNKYHKPTCQWAKKINSSNLVKFSTPEAAIKAGYIPCKVCRPPVKSKAENIDVNPVKYVAFGHKFNNHMRGMEQ